MDGARDGVATAFYGAISGTGGIIFTGSGQVQLEMANSYTGPTTVSSGILHVYSPSYLERRTREPPWPAARTALGARERVDRRRGAYAEWAW